MSSSKKSVRRLPSDLESIRSYISVDKQAVRYSESFSSADTFGAYGVDNSFSEKNFENFKKNLHFDIIAMNDNQIEFDITGIEAPLANALRRILLSEIPTMAIEKVILFQNTSLLSDEMLSHRLGLIPIAADPRRFEYLDENKNIQNEKNTLVFILDVKCTWNNEALKTSKLISQKDSMKNSLITSGMLEWVPQGRQAMDFPEGIKAAFDDIVIAKLRPGQSIEAELHCEKGIGKQHAKWSPVATASYRLMPDILINHKSGKEFLNEEAEQLKKKCPMGVFDIEDVMDDGDKGKKGGDRSIKRAYVKLPRNCTMCRECIREPGWEERIALRRIRNHFIFSVESVGQYKAVDIVRAGIHRLKAKAEKIVEELAKKKSSQKGGKNGEEEEIDDVDDIVGGETGENDMIEQLRQRALQKRMNKTKGASAALSIGLEDDAAVSIEGEGEVYEDDALEEDDGGDDGDFDDDVMDDDGGGGDD